MMKHFKKKPCGAGQNSSINGKVYKASMRKVRDALNPVIS